MPHHAEQRPMAFKPIEMFDLVADVARYPEFLPWCVGVRVHDHVQRGESGIFTADLMIGFKAFRETFTSRVTLDPKPNDNIPAINIEYLDGPFRHLHNQWRFLDNGNGTCTVDFHIDFEFRSRVLQALISGLFNEAVRRMVGAFEQRAKEIYGPEKDEPCNHP